MTKAEFDDVTVEAVDRVAVVRLNDPKTLNAISPRMIGGIAQGLDHIDTQGKHFRALVMTGAGRGFCSGANLTTTGPDDMLKQDDFGRILRETPFEEVWIQPAPGDSGGALGAALYVYHVLLGKPRKFVMEHAYWGQAYSDQEAKTAIEATGRSYQFVEDPERRAEMLVDDVVAGKVVSLFQGRFEWGPRALGNRSILADPRRAEMKEVVNARIKFREPFRPFAPVILARCSPSILALRTTSGPRRKTLKITMRSASPRTIRKLRLVARPR